MQFNKNFFKTHGRTFSEKFFNALKRLKKATFEFLGRLPRVENWHLWFRKNTLLKKGQHFLNALYARLVIRGEYTKHDLAVLFIVAFSVGVGFKTAAAQVITIGFEDYTLPPEETLLNLNAVQKKMIESGSTFIDDPSVQGGVCSE